MNLTNKLNLARTLAATCLAVFILNIQSVAAHALEDHVVVVRNNTLIFDAHENVDEEMDIDEIGVSTAPLHGTLALNKDQTLSFTPNPDVCEQTDYFVYYIRRGDGVDTVTVKVDILCEQLTFLSGFSPDEDGVNDTFTILGVEAFPDNSLVIFNKWGEEVFASKNYKNDWNGTGKDGQSLVSEDNIYYYVFNDGVEEVHSGYIKIN